MPKRRTPLKSLVRGLLRPNWTKQNLYNIFKKGPEEFYTAKFYLQKWRGKRETRAYHGEHLTEGTWKNTFERRLTAVSRLGESRGMDGMTSNERDSLTSDGRVVLRNFDFKDTVPISMKLYAPLERRLDIALFRAMFASSPRQARQFVHQGYVKVNGATTKAAYHPLQPGDIFSVDPNAVLRAVGRMKPSAEQSAKIDEEQAKLFETFLEKCKANSKKMFAEKFEPISVDGFYPADTLYQQAQKLSYDLTRRKIRELEADDYDMTAMKQEVECKIKAEIDSYATIEVDELPTNLDELTRKVVISKSSPDGEDYQELLKTRLESVKSDKLKDLTEMAAVFRRPSNIFHENWYYAYMEEWCGRKMPWQVGSYGLQDASKPYFTPWVPRPFFAPFAILPNHIEVSFKTCHAVYLRDPVVRRGHSEIISPLDLFHHEQAYKFYVGKG
ncbi:mitochondrial 37S ribosomal protein uS4m [Lipomyces oligophaga]|uniref:mitochondrial 37S ribosomal protein uS4m n=1 Tax=Lipomyces oligophaga TaxID=45792 RepID=UPI0034CD1877